MGEILVSQELVQVEYATRLPCVLVSQEFVQVEYEVRPSDIGDIGAEIVGTYITEPEYTYVKSTHEFEDFDVQVDFTVGSGVDTTGCGVEIVFEINSNNKFYIRAGNFLGNQVFMCDFVDNGVSHFYIVSGTNDYGKLRISRYVNNIIVYYKDGLVTDWTVLQSYYPFSVDKGNVLLGFYSGGSFSSSVVLDNFIVNYEKSCQSCCVFDNFYGEDGGLYNQDLWEGSISNIRIYNNKLHMTYTHGYTYVNTKYVPVGDLNVQVDFSIGSYETTVGFGQYLHVYFENNDQVYIRYEYANNRRYTTNAYVNGVWKSSYYNASDIMSGKLRITKIDNTVFSYYLLNNMWHLLASYSLAGNTNVSYISLYKSSWTNNPDFECYFDNFVINSDFDFYNDVVISGLCSHIDGNYMKLVGGNIRTNKLINSANAITFECSVTVENYDSYNSAGLLVCNTPFRSGYTDSSGESIHIVYYTDSFRLYVNGSAYNCILNGDNKLFYPVYGQSYIIGVKFIPGTGTVIYWQGPTSGYLVLNYIINGDLYAWWGNQYGRGVYGSQTTRVHGFRCFEENIPYKELIGSWTQYVGPDDEFLSSDGSSPSNDRWNITGSPKIYNYSLKIIEQNGDKIQSRTFFCAPFEIILDYSGLFFGVVESAALSLNIESYDTYRDKIKGTSKFKVGYSGGNGCWVNYYCGDSSGNSSIYHTPDVSNRRLKIVNDGRKIQYLLSDGVNWITIESLSCNRQYYYKVLVEGTEESVVFNVNSISLSSEGFLSPIDATCLVPTAWKFSPTDKAYQCVTYVSLNDIIGGCRHFSVDCVAKIDSSMFLSYIESDKDLVTFDGAIVVGDTHSTLILAIDAAENGQVIYVLPGSYGLGGYTITKKVLIVGVGDYGLVNVIISGSSTILNGCDVTFKNLTILEQMPYNTYSFKVQGSDSSYITLDSCKYTAQQNNYVYMFKVETSNLFVYMRRCYLYRVNNNRVAYSGNSSYCVMVDILNCRVGLSRNNLINAAHYYKIRSEIYSNISQYEPESTDSIPVFTLFSPRNETNIYLNTPKGLEKIITSKENEFNYLSFGNTPGGVTFYGGDNDYYFSDYYTSSIDESCKLFIQGYIDTIRVFNNYQTYNETLNNINTVGALGLNLRLAHNKSIVEYKIYEPLNLYNSVLYLGQGTQSIIDEFIWSKTKTTTADMAAYYSSYLEKLGYATCNIYIDDAKYKFFIDFGSNIGVGSLIQSVLHNFTNTIYYSDGVSDPALLNTACSLSEARWYSLYNGVSQHASSLTPGKFSVFPSVSGCDESRWEYTGECGYVDVLPGSVLNASSSLNDVYNIKWKRNKTSVDEYFVSNFSDFLIISLKLFGGGTCKRIEIKSGYNIGTEFAGYITKCSILIDGIPRFSIDNNINSIIIADFSSISFSTIDVVIEEVKQVPSFVFNGTMLTGNAVFINHVKVLSASSSRTFSDTLCNIYEFDSPIKVDSIDTSKTGTCSLDYYYSEQGVDGCITITTMVLNNPPNSEIKSVLVKSDNLYSCAFAIDEYVVDIVEESMTGSVESWKVYIGDVELYEEFFYLQGTSTSVGFKFFKETIFEVGTYYEDFGTNIEWAITDELVLNIYASNPISSFYICIGNKADGIYYRWDFSLVVGWNNLRFNFYDSYVTKYSFNVLTEILLFNALVIFNVWCGGSYQYGDGFVVLDNVFVDRSSVSNTLSSHKDAFYIPISFESESGSIHIDYVTYWGNDGVMFGDMLSDKTILSVFGDELCFSLINKISGKFVLGVYSYKHNVRTVKSFGYAQKFNINDTVKIRLAWFCRSNQFFSDLYINGGFVGRVIFNLVETNKLKVTGIMVGGGSVYITSVYNSLSLCGQLKYIKVYSSNMESKLTNDRLLIKHDGNYKNLVDNSPLYVGEIQPSNYVMLPIKYEGKSKELNQLNLKVKWIGIY